MLIEPELLRRCWFLAGPTASGKSAVALALAEELPGEIVALDSMTLYRGMDIGTAKPSHEERRRVPHHLFDILDPSEDFSVADYVTAAERAVREILARGRVPLFVGGTGLYLRSLLRGVFEGPPADWSLRQRLQDLVAAEGEAALHERLRQVDPTTAARLAPQDTRRVIRALEVWELTGQPLSAQQQQAVLPEGQRPPHVYWLEPPRDWLHERINRRVEHMLEQGLVDEVRSLWKREPPLSHTARQALAYKEIFEWLEGGEGPLDPVVELIQTRTRQFAKRQHTWFRNLVECQPLAITHGDRPEDIARRLWERRVKGGD